MNVLKNKYNLTHARKKIKECKDNQYPDLDISSCGITDLNELPELFECNHLETLDLSDNEISDIGFLGKLTGLQDLDLSNNQITYIGFVEKLTKLQVLNLSYNPIMDFSFLEKLTELDTLDLNGNQINNFGFLENLTGLQELYLDKEYDIRFIAELCGLENLAEYPILPGESVLDEMLGLDDLEIISNDSDDDDDSL